MMTSYWMAALAGGLVALAVLAIGVRGLITKKPFAYPTRYHLWIIGIVLLPALIGSLEAFLDGSAGWFDLLFFAIIVVVFVFLRKQMSGYFIVGLTDDSFRTALRSALQRNSIRFEETLSHLHLPELGADLQANVQSGMGGAQLRIKQPQHQDTLKRIVNTLNEEFSSPAITVNKTIFVVYVILGVLLFMTAFLAFASAQLSQLLTS